MKEETLKKSIDAMIEEVFMEEKVEKSIDIAKDADTTADEAVAAAPKAQDDAKRGAGRPAQISDVPKTDMDGERAKEYDASITEREGVEEENEEAKKQCKAEDQTSKPGKASKAPEMRPFKKSISEEEYEEFQAFKKSQEVAKEEELKKAQLVEREDLIKAEVAKHTEELRKSMEELRKSNEEKDVLLKALKDTPVRPKSVTGITQLEKSISEEVKEQGPEVLTKSQLLDVAEELFKSGKLTDAHVSELEMTGRIYDANARKAIEDYVSENK